MAVLAPQEGVSDVEMARLCANGTPAEVRAALDLLNMQKRAIEAQLAEAKAAGKDADTDWRSRAVRALTVKERQLLRLRVRMVALVGQVAATMPERRVVIFEGTPIEVADELQGWVDDGWSALNVVVYKDVLIVTLRKDFK